LYPLTQLLLDSLELCPHAVPPGLSFDQVAALAGSSADDSRTLRDDLLEPFPLLAYRLSYPLTHLLLDSVKLCPHAVAPGLSFD
jgi:hypothetical protein